MIRVHHCLKSCIGSWYGGGWGVGEGSLTKSDMGSYRNTQLNTRHKAVTRKKFCDDFLIVSMELLKSPSGSCLYSITYVVPWMT